MAQASILLVDDTVANLRLLSSILEPLGYEARPATNGRQALSAAEHAPPDLVLLDINMPGMDGYEVCEAFKANPSLKDIPIIFLTAMSELADKVKAFSIGGVDFITKPFYVEEVLARVKTHLALRRAHIDLQESYQKLQRLEQLRDDLVNMVVHDMRSPLMGLMGYLSFLHEDAEANQIESDAANDARTAMKSVHELARMANDILDVSRIEEGRFPLNLAEHDLGAIAKEVQTSMRGFERGRAIELKVDAPVLASCDGNLIRRVLENLVSNAIKHAPSSSCVEIVVSPTAQSVRLEVCDEGRGVPPEARERIFDKFESAAVRKQTAYHSAGLGLAFCKLVIEAHHGTIGVDDREPKGSCFWFELPRQAQ